MPRETETEDLGDAGMIHNKLLDHDKEILDIKTYSSEPDWKDTLASRMMELSLQGWWYESSNFMKDYYAGYIIDIRFIRFRNGPIATNIDADLISEIISI